MLYTVFLRGQIEKRRAKDKPVEEGGKMEGKRDRGGWRERGRGRGEENGG